MAAGTHGVVGRVKKKQEKKDAKTLRRKREEVEQGVVSLHLCAPVALLKRRGGLLKSLALSNKARPIEATLVDSSKHLAAAVQGSKLVGVRRFVAVVHFFQDAPHQLVGHAHEVRVERVAQLGTSTTTRAG